MSVFFIEEYEGYKIKGKNKYENPKANGLNPEGLKTNGPINT